MVTFTRLTLNSNCLAYGEGLEVAYATMIYTN